MVFKTERSRCATPYWDISRTVLLKCDRNSRMANEMWDWSLCGGESFIFILKLNYYRENKNKINTRIIMFIGMMDFRMQRFNFLEYIISISLFLPEEDYVIFSLPIELYNSRTRTFIKFTILLGILYLCYNTFSLYLIIIYLCNYSK